MGELPGFIMRNHPKVEYPPPRGPVACSSKIMSNTVKLGVLKEIVDLFRRIKKKKKKSYVKLEWLMNEGSEIVELKEGVRRLCELGVFADEGEDVKKIFYLNNERFPLHLSDEVLDVEYFFKGSSSSN